MEQDLYNVHIDDKGHLHKDKKHPIIAYVNMRLMIDKDIQPWANKFEKAFKLLDKENEYNIHILLKADSCKTDEKTIVVQNLKKIVIIDK